MSKSPDPFPVLQLGKGSGNTRYARIPGYKNTDLKLLPSSISKLKIWRIYYESAEYIEDVHPSVFSTYCKLWLPFSDVD